MNQKTILSESDVEDTGAATANWRGAQPCTITINFLFLFAIENKSVNSTVLSKGLLGWMYWIVGWKCLDYDTQMLGTFDLITKQ